MCDITQHHAHRIIFGAATRHVSDVLSFKSFPLSKSCTIRFKKKKKKLVEWESFTFTCVETRHKKRVIALKKKKRKTVI